ncbi:LOW QUALITY PROTEIN: hypothetical protein TorRG33x02_312070 [Trema orientale]|uniref:Uncharacterized protein n=1 Tax=Trema orientale TaxID=63057 RepID=A0A2P5BQW3_TREOI|nr:LOW QUALITY PROTEIN: hypothetical protein TorRG33x02_312070 [Trema orientale]
MMSWQISAFNSKTMLKLQNTYKEKTETRAKKNISKIRPKKLNNVRQKHCTQQWRLRTLLQTKLYEPKHSHVQIRPLPPTIGISLTSLRTGFLPRILRLLPLYLPSVKTKFKTISNATSFCAAME